jgi:hypothetical protein
MQVAIAQSQAKQARISTISVPPLHAPLWIYKPPREVEETSNHTCEHYCKSCHTGP